MPPLNQLQAKYSRRAVLGPLALTFGPRLVFAGVRPSQSEQEQMGQLAVRFMQEHAVPGLSFAFARFGELLCQGAIGFADWENQEQITTAHIFRIASVSKPITSAALFSLFEQGAASLDSPVFGANGILNEYTLPPGQPYVPQIRLRHLLTHTAGGWSNTDQDPMFRQPILDARQLIQWTLTYVPLSSPPGQRYAYSNVGYCILGRVIERLTQRPYAEYVTDAVLRRCGSNGMKIGQSSATERLPNEVRYLGARGEDPYGMNVPRMDSHGGWVASPTDLIQFVSHIDGFSAARNILRPGTIAEMTTGTEANRGYACGWGVSQNHHWSHNGSLPGTSSVLARHPRGYCWAAIANSREQNGNTSNALDALMWAMAKKVNGWGV